MALQAPKVIRQKSRSKVEDSSILRFQVARTVQDNAFTLNPRIYHDAINTHGSWESPGFTYLTL